MALGRTAVRPYANSGRIVEYCQMSLPLYIFIAMTVAIRIVQPAGAGDGVEPRVERSGTRG